MEVEAGKVTVVVGPAVVMVDVEVDVTVDTDVTVEGKKTF